MAVQVGSVHAFVASYLSGQMLALRVGRHRGQKGPVRAPFNSHSPHDSPISPSLTSSDPSLYFTKPSQDSHQAPIELPPFLPCPPSISSSFSPFGESSFPPVLLCLVSTVGHHEGQQGTPRSVLLAHVTLLSFMHGKRDV
jgi:hypothetical protein